MTLGDKVAVLRRGLLQQHATPRELYENPANLFVAGFIGSPPMNFLPATLEGQTLSLPFGTVELSERNAARAAGHEVLVAGIRPEYFEDAALHKASSDDCGVTFEADVDVVEWLGHEAYAYIPFAPHEKVSDDLSELAKDLETEGQAPQLVVALDAASEIKAGSRAELWCDFAKGHLFDPVTGFNLTLDPDNAGRVTGAVSPKIR
jgi:multiple sugar transport system ATP-binding protein